ncbi:hypothetical protein GCK72_002127 [Caenorhabditis remanei]|uniref:Uncharacterized protein n=1 Tax=Caenorhabditis remanei TaxID=31234 RepID=A0A6A5HRI1_CAERE|nr:hypothetical protein GCK72_002127 [Caenorhabditis remanei]KAF1770309.1 hypothetical protein GCK72_002127 [Caenorhabditis remanei]
MNFIILVTAVSLINLVICETSTESTVTKINQISTSEINSASNNADNGNSILLKSIEQILKREMISQTSNMKTIKTAKAQTHPSDPKVQEGIVSVIIEMQKKEAETLKKDIDYLDKQREEKQNKLVKLYKEMNMMKPGEPITAAPPKPQDHYVVPGAGQSEIVIELVPLPATSENFTLMSSLLIRRAVLCPNPPNIPPRPPPPALPAPPAAPPPFNIR